MAKIYFAAPLFCKAELDFNANLASVLRKNGHEVFLPQEECGEKDNVSIFNDDIKHIDGCEIFLFVMDGRVPDEGASFELGYAYAKGKTCVGLKTDVRTSERGGDNIMLECSLNYGIARSVPELVCMLEGCNGGMRQ